MDFSLEEEDRVFAIEVSTAIFLFNRARGHGSGCTTAPSGMQYLVHVFIFPVFQSGVIFSLIERIC